MSDEEAGGADMSGAEAGGAGTGSSAAGSTGAGNTAGSGDAWGWGPGAGAGPGTGTGSGTGSGTWAGAAAGEARGGASSAGRGTHGAGAGSTRPGPEQGPAPVRPPLRRDRRSRMIAGVCGGLGRHLDVDPVVFRILFAVLTFIGGFGLLAYAAAWLFVPDDGERESEAHRLLTGRSALGAVAIAVLVVLGGMVALTTLARGLNHAVPLLVLAAAIVLVLIWRGDARRGRGPETGVGPGAGPGAGDRPQPWWQRPVPTYPAPTYPTPSPTGAAGGSGPADAPPASAPDPAATSEAAFASALGWEYRGYTPGAETAGAPGAIPEFDAPRQRRLSGLSLSAALLALGLIGVLVQSGVFHVGGTSGLALAIMAVGAGMVVGGLFGRARALIPLGLVLSVPLIVANSIGVPLRGETGSQTWTPASAATLRSPYNLAAGKGQLDLSNVDPRGGTVHVTAYVGAGQILVTVPDDVAVQITAHVGVGRMQFPGGELHSGLDLTNGFNSAAIGSSHGTIVLDLKAGAGDLEVDRAN
ncbi:MAG TPA: PspC domain-containing protein [Actinocrinis sp.]|nr:PspC domain-containing protein [Actinocrinis sp.]